MTKLIQRFCAPLSLCCVLAAAFALPYLMPGNPDSAALRSGSLSLLLMLALFFPVRIALSRQPLRALRLTAANLLSPGGAVLFAALGLLLLRGFLRARDRRALLCGMAGHALLALLPLLWIMAAAQPSIIHEYFQYRTLGGTVFALCCMAALPGLLRRDADG